MKTALVTGCSGGIGRAVTQALLDDGWRVVGVSRRVVPGLDRQARFVGCWGDLHFGAVAVPNLRRVSIEVLDAVVHCAATQHPVGPIRSSDQLAWAESIQINLIGTYHVVRGSLPYLERSPDARILLFSGGGAFSPRPNYSAYAAAKAGVVALMEALAGELPPGITVNCVAPGFVATPIHTVTLAAGADVVGEQEYAHANRPDTGQRAEVVACVRHLLSPAAARLTGKTIAVGWDPWDQITPATVPFFNSSDIWTRTRVKAQHVPIDSAGVDL